MNSTIDFFERTYYKLPVFFQNIVVSFKGLTLNRKRKRGRYADYLVTIKSRRSWTKQEFESFQLREINSLLELVGKEFPVYSDLYGDVIPNLSNLADLEKLPILSRFYLRNNPEKFTSRPTRDQLSIHTTGTSGSPLKVVCDLESRQKNFAFFDAYLESVGVRLASPHIIIGGRAIVSPDSTQPPFWRKSRWQKSLLMSSYHLSDNFLTSYIDAIERYGAEYIESYPSSLYIIARYMLKVGRKVKVKLIVTSAETLFDDQREIIEEAFQCKIYDQYGCAEMGLFVAQCKSGSYHVRPDYGILEIVDANGKGVDLGVEGDVVCTGFVNKCMPLIRYDIGDRAAWKKNQTCTCGLNTPILEKIYGRKDDIIVTGDGRPVGRLSPVLKGFPVKESQYIQYSPGEVDVNIIPDDGFQLSDKKKILDAVRIRMGGNTKVKLHIVDKLVRGKGGKLKNVISHV